MPAGFECHQFNIRCHADDAKSIIRRRTHNTGHSCTVFIEVEPVLIMGNKITGINDPIHQFGMSTIYSSIHNADDNPFSSRQAMDVFNIIAFYEVLQLKIRIVIS